MLIMTSHIAALGALITIVAVGLDAFFQQTITYTIEPALNTTGEAMVAVARKYTSLPNGASSSDSPRNDAEFAAVNSLFRAGSGPGASPVPNSHVPWRTAHRDCCGRIVVTVGSTDRRLR